MNRCEHRREWAAKRGRSGTKRWSAEGRRVSAFVHHQAIGVYSCFRDRRNDLGWSSRERTRNAGPVRPVCPTNTRRQHLKYSEAAEGWFYYNARATLEILSRQLYTPTTSRQHIENIPRQVCLPTTSRQNFEYIPRQVCPPTTSLHDFENIPRKVYPPTTKLHILKILRGRYVLLPRTGISLSPRRQTE